MPRPRSETVEGKPPLSYVSLCVLAIQNSRSQRATLAEIYEYITTNYSYYKDKPPKWQNSLRHNLSFNDCFIKIPRNGAGKGNYWAIHPNSICMFEHGTFQRRKKRFKVETDKDKDGQPKTTIDNPHDVSLYTHHPGAQPPHDLATHDAYMQHQLWEQSNLYQQYYDYDSTQFSLQDYESRNHSLESEETLTKLDYTIENLLRPDSPKRKKKVYSSAEKSNVSSSSSNRKKKESKNVGYFSLDDSLSSARSSPESYQSSSPKSCKSSSPDRLHPSLYSPPSRPADQYPNLYWPTVMPGVAAATTTSNSSSTKSPLYIPRARLPGVAPIHDQAAQHAAQLSALSAYHNLYSNYPNLLLASHDTAQYYPRVYGDYLNQQIDTRI